jgi:hypothetical protein
MESLIRVFQTLQLSSQVHLVGKDFLGKNATINPKAPWTKAGKRKNKNGLYEVVAVVIVLVVDSSSSR